MISLHDVAIKYALQGWHVFPLKPNSKATIRGFRWGKYATTDANVIDEWWTGQWKDEDGRVFPEINRQSNIGIACNPSNLLVLDIDVKDDRNGMQTYMDLVIRLGGEHTPTLTIRTPTGGVHYYYKIPASVYVPSVADIKGYTGIDTRARGGEYGGMVVAYPSYVTSKGGYSVAHSLAVADAPQWIIDEFSFDKAAVEAKLKKRAEDRSNREAVGLEDGEDEVRFHVTRAINNIQSITTNRNTNLVWPARELIEWLGADGAKQLFYKAAQSHVNKSFQQWELDKLWNAQVHYMKDKGF